VLITGCDSGFGHELAIKLDKLGFSVFACCLDKNSVGAKKLTSLCSQNVHVLQLNVTNQDDIEEVAKYVSSSGIQLYGLVNNAGIAHSAFIEWGNQVDELKSVMDVNCFGPARMAKMCLPLMRRGLMSTKDGRLDAKVINVASLAGKSIQLIKLIQSNSCKKNWLLNC